MTSSTAAGIYIEELDLEMSLYTHTTHHQYFPSGTQKHCGKGGIGESKRTIYGAFCVKDEAPSYMRRCTLLNVLKNQQISTQILSIFYIK